MAVFLVFNEDVADVFEQLADLLETQQANPYRVRAYREAARTVRSLTREVVEILHDEGRAGLERLPGIGKSIAASIEELAHLGRLRVLERLRGQVSPEDLFTTVPGIGEELAHSAHRELGVETLEELELAAHDGRLERVPGFGPRRSRLIRDALGGMLGRSARRRARRIRRREVEGLPDHEVTRPSIELLLHVDQRYRRLATEGRLRRIAPRRFNPANEAWLPILHHDGDGWSLTAMYSNTARAHELRKTFDWVVIYHERDGHEDQCTVVTEFRGPLAGQRVVRGRERESAEYYRRTDVRAG